MKKRVQSLVGDFWRQILGYALALAVVIGVLWFQLGTLVPGFSLPELAARTDADSIRKLIENPLFLPHKLVQFIFIQTGQTDVFWMRTASVLFAVLILALFFDIIRSWYSQRVALMGTFLLLTSAWFLHFARLGTPQILFAFSIGLLWVGMKLRSHTAPRIRTILASIVIVAVSLYVPGLPWLIIPLLIWQRKLILKEFSKIPRVLAFCTGALIAIGMAPLVYGLIMHPGLIRDWLLIPHSIALGQWWSNAWHMPFWLTLRGPQMPVYWLGRVPLLDSLSLVMFVLGIFVLSYYRDLDRVRAIVAIILFSCILGVFVGPVALTIALPLIFIVITAGIALLLQQWFTIFPRNPLARSVGLLMICFVIGLAGYYNLRSYFVAWPRAIETKQVFRVEQS